MEYEDTREPEWINDEEVDVDRECSSDDVYINAVTKDTAEVFAKLRFAQLNRKDNVDMLFGMFLQRLYYSGMEQGLVNTCFFTGQVPATLRNVGGMIRLYWECPLCGSQYEEDYDTDEDWTQQQQF